MSDFDFMASRLEALINSQRQLISDISHELRSPLARVSAALGLARQRFGPDVLFDRIERDAGRLNEMIERLLTLARLDATSVVLARQPIDVRGFVGDIVADARWEAQERQCRVEFTCEGDCVLDANPDLLRSAIENIVRNAVRHTAADTVVEVRARCWMEGDAAKTVIEADLPSGASTDRRGPAAWQRP